MENKASAIGWKAALVMGVYILLVGLTCIFAPDYVWNVKFEVFTGQSWGEFSISSSKLADLYRTDLRDAGGLCLCIAILVIGIARNSLRRGERWAWITLPVAGVCCFGSPVYVGVVTGCWMCLATGIVGFVLLAVTVCCHCLQK